MGKDMLPGLRRAPLSTADLTARICRRAKKNYCHASSTLHSGIFSLF